jgi:hypothetical protein
MVQKKTEIDFRTLKSRYFENGYSFTEWSFNRSDRL